MLAAGLAVLSAGADASALMKGFHSFINAPHRLERIATIQEVLYINDSKATNPDSVRYALEAMEQPVIWVAGGKDKGNDYGQLEDLIRHRVKALICLTKYPEPLLAAFSNIIPNIQVTESVEEAVQIAHRLASPGDVVLLSPACASFDLFKNYEDRGNQFRDRVLALASETQSVATVQEAP
jgi:UDP-N-acetylmuramoylalanine--D-glutamate ligase